jgi:SAM-dependent methyltransferase
MNWGDFEQVIVSEIQGRYVKLSDDLQKADFLSGIYRAKSEMLKLNAGGNVDYCLPYMGEAYAIYYHMLRADNIFLALSAISSAHQLPARIKLLDIGSGTGSGTTAVCYWLGANVDSSIRKSVEVYGVERSEPMSKMAGSLIRHLRQRIRNTQTNVLHYQLSNTQIAIDRLGNGIFDLVLFSYTFDVYESDKQAEVMSRVLQLTQKLRQNGVALFLSPNPIKTVSPKVEFMETLITYMKSNGMKLIPIKLRRSAFACDEKRSVVLRGICEFLNSECQRLGLPIIYEKQDDFPWYGFYGRCSALTWPTNPTRVV